MALASRSFRRGGAFTLLSYGMPLANIAVLGRWAPESSSRLYVRQCEILLVKAAAQLFAHGRVPVFARRFVVAWSVVGKD